MKGRKPNNVHYFQKNTDSMFAPFQDFIFKENTIRRALP
jgi:hypothetical protein